MGGGRRELVKRVNKIFNSPPAVIIKSNKTLAATTSKMLSNRNSIMMTPPKLHQQ